MSLTSLGRWGGSDLGAAAVVIGVAAGAWALTADRMAGMNPGPGVELGGLGWFAISWLLMMAAMMLPALTPAVIVSVHRPGRAGEAGRFVAGYLGVWLAAGFVVYAASEAVRSLQFGFFAWANAGRWVAAGVIAAAGLYQLTPSKDACLRRCRDHLILRDHQRGGLGLGIQHARFCVGCSWALIGRAVRARRDEPDMDGARDGADCRGAAAAPAGAPRGGVDPSRPRGLRRGRAG